TTAALARDDLPPGASLRELGTHRLKDLQRAEPLFQLVHPDLPAEFPPLRSLEAFAHNLPVQWTSFIGREREMAEVRRLLRATRLLTLTGTGGIGKTRLSFQIAREMQPHLADGICFVHLAAVSETDLVIPRIAQELGIQEIGGQPILEAIKASLSKKEFLLLLDNFEQVVETAPLIEDLLIACPRLKVVVTSRATLNLDAEQVFHVPPLAFPSDMKMLTQEELLTQYAAIALFVQRARAIASFQMTQTNAKSIAEICKRLDGLPLAIELAAARMKILSPEALLAKLDEPLKTLTSQSRTLPLRHQTLRNAIQWSYDLLDAGEQRMFRRLSVFRGALVIEAVEAMQQAMNEVDNVPVIDRLASLLDKSLLYRSQIEGMEPYIQMLLTVREYALDLLQESGEFEQARRAHAMHYLNLAEQADLHLKGPQQLKWLAQLEMGQENLWVALAWCMEHIGYAEVEETALRLCGALGWFWFLRGYWSEARRWLDGILGADSSSEATAARAKARYVSGMLAYQQDDYVQARPLLEESRRIYDWLGMKREYANALGTLGQLTYLQGDLDTAWSMLKESETLCRSLDDAWGLISALRRLGYVMLGENDLAQALVNIQEGLELARQLGDKYLLAILLLTQGDIAASQSDLAQAVALDQEGLGFARELGHKSLIALAMQNL
ncbi:MAG TPA: NB-ARC domain-containing protein, partial [Ktedonobacteraceae bacterium]|nr:NB-ARC domain-containing protein [Ktedonobacteraceae bacterium]